MLSESAARHTSTLQSPIRSVSTSGYKVISIVIYKSCIGFKNTTPNLDSHTDVNPNSTGDESTYFILTPYACD
ncbi:MAG: hypothetical protein IPG99_11655 [Ignavibacteria bacterium]|nr:hypothetical protein [Ignavibacteria bacterium]